MEGVAVDEEEEEEEEEEEAWRNSSSTEWLLMALGPPTFLRGRFWLESPSTVDLSSNAAKFGA